MELREYLRILKRRKWIVILTTLVTAAVVGLGSYMQEPTYSAATTVRVAQASSGSVDVADYMYAERLMNTYVQILKSRPLLEEIIRRLALAISPWDLANQIRVEILGDTELLRITVADHNPARAKAIADVLAALLIEQNRSLYLGGARSAREILEEQLSVVADSLAQDRAALQALLNNTTAGQEQIDALSTRIGLESEIYANLLSQYEQARLTEASLANSITVVEPAVLPGVPSGPRTKRNLVLGTLVGLVAGTGLAFLLENLDPTLHSLGDLEAAAGVSVLGSIHRFAIPRGSPQGVVLVNGDRPSQTGEAFRILGNNILALASDMSLRTLLITSAEQGAGKSTVLVNLAAAMAQAGHKVAAVDGDFRNSCLHRVFELSNEMGLSDVLSDLRRMNRALQETSIEGVSVLTSGPLPPNPSEPPPLSKLPKVLGNLARKADLVLLDSPPILAIADAATMASMVDGVLLVAAKDQATGRRVQRALQQMARVGAKPLGVVFNRAAAADGDYYYYPYGGGRKESAESALSSLLGNLGGRFSIIGRIWERNAGSDKDRSPESR